MTVSRKVSVLGDFAAGKISAGIAAAQLGLTKVAFLEVCCKLGISPFNYEDDEVEAELRRDMGAAAPGIGRFLIHKAHLIGLVHVAIERCVRARDAALVDSLGWPNRKIVRAKLDKLPPCDMTTGERCVDQLLEMLRKLPGPALWALLADDGLDKAMRPDPPGK